MDCGPGDEIRELDRVRGGDPDQRGRRKFLSDHVAGVLFEDDTLVGAAEREATRRDLVFGSVRPVRHEGAVEHIEVNTRVVPRERF